ncbi:Beta-1-syntrophin [Melipona quadrifasciata]|uniref:Beta-1-syntrophin n=1 Tax=Melipona quadrifasciata TaxID=166423 RepID=A0A0N0U6K9_9HYME|nr:Beta-1-syntrophin [Melipona quadrifasciata]
MECLNVYNIKQTQIKVFVKKAKKKKKKKCVSMHRTPLESKLGPVMYRRWDYGNRFASYANHPVYTVTQIASMLRNKDLLNVKFDIPHRVLTVIKGREMEGCMDLGQSVVNEVNKQMPMFVKFKENDIAHGSESSEDGAGSSASTSRGAGSGFGLGGGCTGGWRSVFGAVSGRELRLYECAPWSPEAWASPSITCPLIATRGFETVSREISKRESSLRRFCGKFKNEQVEVGRFDLLGISEEQEEAKIATETVEHFKDYFQSNCFSEQNYTLCDLDPLLFTTTIREIKNFDIELQVSKYIFPTFKYHGMLYFGHLPTFFHIIMLKRPWNKFFYKTGLLVSSPARQNEAGSSNSGTTQHAATFAVRVGTIDGVVTHHLRAETRRDLAAWARAIVQGCHAAAHSLREYTFELIIANNSKTKFSSNMH